MTLSMAWIRKLGEKDELVVATDSRLRFGCAWDACPKIWFLPRSDALICFAGDTMYAYPIMEQIRCSIDMNLKVRSRALDLGALRGHLIRILNRMYAELGDPPKGKQSIDPPEVSFILAGYSWLSAEFKIWTIYYNKIRRKFEYSTPSTLHRNSICFAGDNVEDAKKQILKTLKDRGKSLGSGFEMEPFEILRDMCRDPAFKHIGGAPQLAKVYRHMNTMPYAVFWPDRSSMKVSFMGRPLLDYEVASYLILDPDSLETVTFAERVAEQEVGLVVRSLVPEEDK